MVEEKLDVEKELIMLGRGEYGDKLGGVEARGEEKRLEEKRSTETEEAQAETKHLICNCPICDAVKQDEQDTPQVDTGDQIDLITEHKNFKVALTYILDYLGWVCDEFEVCEHVGCQSSAQAQMVATAAINGEELPPEVYEGVEARGAKKASNHEGEANREGLHSTFPFLCQCSECVINTRLVHVEPTSGAKEVPEGCTCPRGLVLTDLTDLSAAEELARQDCAVHGGSAESV